MRALLCLFVAILVALFLSVSPGADADHFDQLLPVNDSRKLVVLDLVLAPCLAPDRGPSIDRGSSRDFVEPVTTLHYRIAGSVQLRYTGEAVVGPGVTQHPG